MLTDSIDYVCVYVLASYDVQSIYLKHLV